MRNGLTAPRRFESSRIEPAYLAEHEEALPGTLNRRTLVPIGGGAHDLTVEDRSRKSGLGRNRVLRELLR